MKDVTIRDLLDLVEAEVPDAELHLQKMFEWYFERDMTISKWILGAAASLGVSALIAFFKEEIHPTQTQAVILALVPLLSGGYGAYRLMRVRSIHRHFVAALKVYRQLRGIAVFVRRYRGELAK